MVSWSVLSVCWGMFMMRPVRSDGAAGEIAVVGGFHQSFHRGKVERAGIVLDQPIDAEGEFCGPINLVSGKSKTGQCWSDPNRREHAADFFNRRAGHLAVAPARALEAESDSDFGDFGCRR